ncbi:MAG TPA: hypothetical protein VJZ69_03660 [Clostridia bacterium]|nr:hypothetical protein [Clostridia bacterium]
MIKRQPKSFIFGIFFLTVAIIFELAVCSFPVAYADASPSNLKIVYANEQCFVNWTYSYGNSYSRLILNGSVIEENLFNSSMNCSFEITSFIKTANHYTLQVCATDGIEMISAFSTFEFTITKTLNAPPNLDATINNMLAWDSVENAEYYQVLINLIPICTTDKTSIDLSNFLKYDAALDIFVTANSNQSDLYLPSVPQTIKFSYFAPISAPDNVSIVFFEGEYFLSWTKVLGASHYHFYDTNTLAGGFTSVDLEASTTSTANNFANITSLINGGCKTVSLIASSDNGKLSQVVNVELS